MGKGRGEQGWICNGRQDHGNWQPETWEWVMGTMGTVISNGVTCIITRFCIGEPCNVYLEGEDCEVLVSE